jgi:hypothetical protein
MATAKENFTKLRQLRRDIKKEVNSSDPAARERIEAMRALESSLEEKIDVAAVASGKPELLNQIKEARQKIAVLKVVDLATETWGQVNPEKLFKLREAGFPLTGNLEKIALFYDSFKPSSAINTTSNSGGFGVNPSFTTRQAAMGRPEGLLSGGFPVLSDAMRDYLLSKGSQKNLSKLRPYKAPDSATLAAARQAASLASLEAGRSNTPEKVKQWLDTRR